MGASVVRIDLKCAVEERSGRFVGLERASPQTRQATKRELVCGERVGRFAGGTP